MWLVTAVLVLTGTLACAESGTRPVTEQPDSRSPERMSERDDYELRPSQLPVNSRHSATSYVWFVRKDPEVTAAVKRFAAEHPGCLVRIDKAEPQCPSGNATK